MTVSAPRPAAPLLHLLQLCSPSLPVGAYSYSQGLEAAMHAGWVHDEVTARDWIIQMLDQVVARFEAPITLRLIAAFTERDARRVRYWTDFFIAARDSAEFRAETLQMGYSLGKLLPELVPDQAAVTDLLPPLSELPFPTALAAAAVALQVNDDDALLGMLFSWGRESGTGLCKICPAGTSGGSAFASLAGGTDCARCANRATTAR